MILEKWLLSSFTLLTQLAVGTYIFSVFIRTLKKVDPSARIIMTRIGMNAVGALMLIILGLQTFSIITPLELDSESFWLDSAFLCSIFFFALWSTGYFLEKKGIWSHLIGWVNVIIGLGIIISLATYVYTSQMFQTWSDFHIYLTFLGTAIVSGATLSIISVLLSKEVKTPQVISICKVIGVIGVVTLSFQLASMPVFMTSLTVSAELVFLILSDYLALTVMYWSCSIVGVSLLLYGLFYKASFRTFYKWSVGPMSLVLIGEFCGKYLFYVIGI